MKTKINPPEEPKDDPGLDICNEDIDPASDVSDVWTD